MFFFFLLCFIFYKIGEQESRTGSAGMGREVEEGAGGGGRGRRMDMVQAICTHNVNAKMMPVETVTGIRG
jgi:hypothetical protein